MCTNCTQNEKDSWDIENKCAVCHKDVGYGQWLCNACDYRMSLCGRRHCMNCNRVFLLDRRSNNKETTTYKCAECQT